MSETTDRALSILRAHPDGLTAREFAWLMWPDNPAWEKVSKIGHGATRGVGMWRAGGGYLGKLVKKGLVWRRLTEAGQYIYEAAE